MAKNIKHGFVFQNNVIQNHLSANGNLHHNHQHPNATNKAIPEKILDELSCRFIINIPDEERGDLIRVLFQIELAHWFYLDFNCIENVNLVKVQFREFTRIIFNHIPFLNPHLPKLESVIEQWREYKQSVPTCGAILLDESLEYVLMVQGYWSKGGWGFPKGKINADEDPLVCAVREVREETGYDCDNKIRKDDFIELKIRDTFVRLYIVPYVNKNHMFKPITRNEIKHIEWFKVADLPQNKRDMAFRQNLQLNANCFFMAIPFIKPLRRWITRKRKFQNATNATTHELKLFNREWNDNYYAFGRNTKYWAKCWDNVQLDWNKIWNNIE